jgi:hypothetical protein
MYRFIVFVRRVVDGVESAIGDTLTAAGPDWAYDTTEARCGGGGYPEQTAHSIARGMTQGAYTLLRGLDFYVQEFDAEDIEAGTLTPEDKEMAEAISLGLLPSDGSVAFVSGLVNRADSKPFWFVVAIHD